MGLFNRIRPDPGFVSPVRSNLGFVSPIRSDPIWCDPGFVNGQKNYVLGTGYLLTLLSQDHK